MTTRLLLLLACVVCAGMSVDGRSQPAKKSPFLPPQSQAAAPIAENTPIEFRGLLAINGQQRFNFFEPTKRVSTWVGLNENGATVAVKSFDAVAETVSVDFAGRSMTLALQKVKISSVPAPAMTAMGPASTTPIEQPSVVLNPTPADEARRLDSIAAEVRRRRLLRQQATPSAVPAN